MRIMFFGGVAALLAIMSPAAAQNENFEAWPVLINPFPSTGGDGVMIDGYDPKIVGDACVTPFTARTLDGQIYRNIVEFKAIPVQGGVLCAEGRWRSVDGSAQGTTPFRVFIKDGVTRASPG